MNLTMFSTGDITTRRQEWTDPTVFSVDSFMVLRTIRSK